MRSRSLSLVFVAVFILFQAVACVYAGDFLALQGNVKQGGVDLTSGNLRVLIYDSASGGNLIYNSSSDFNNAIANGKYDVLLGNTSQELNLQYGRKYYFEIYVNNERLNYSNGIGRQVFQSAVGNISSAYLNLSGGGYVPYTGASQNVDLGNNNFLVNGTTFFINATSGRIGIGTSAPTTALDVNGTIYFEGGSGDIDGDGDVDSNDGSSCLQALEGIYEPTKQNLTQGDVNGDGVLSMEDCYLMLAIYGWSPETIGSKIRPYGVGNNQFKMLTDLSVSGNISAGEQIIVKNTLDGGYIQFLNSTGNYDGTRIFKGGSNNLRLNSGFGNLYINSMNNGIFVIQNDTVGNGGTLIFSPANGNLNITGNLYAANFPGSGGGNSSFNQSLTDGIYVPYTGATQNVDLNGKNLTNFINLASLDSLATGKYSIATGESTTASGWASTAMGSLTTASGEDSTAMGVASEASGLQSTALGALTKASGDTSTAMGYITTASGDYSTAIGRNIDCSQEGAFCFGGGNMGIGTGTPTQKLDVRGNVNVSNNVTATYFIGSGRYLTDLPAGGNSSFNQTLADGIYVPYTGANKSIDLGTQTFSTNGTANFDGGWQQGGVTIDDGKIFAQVGYFYNISSLSITHLEVNGSMIPYFNNTFDLGSANLSWRNGYFTGNLNVGGDVFINGQNITGDYVPYSGANRNVNLSNKNITANMFKSSGNTGIEFQTLQNIWAFKYANGIGSDDTGVYFNVIGAKYEIKAGGVNIWDVDTSGNVNNYGTLTAGDFVNATNGIFVYSGDSNSYTDKMTISDKAIRFKQDVGDESNAGVIMYRTFDTNALEIVGASNNSNDRFVRIYDTLSVGYNGADVDKENASLVIDRRVGIGTATPANMLNVIGDANITGNATAAYFIGSGRYLTDLPTGGNLSFNQTLTDSLYVPYAGAINNVDLGEKNLSTNGTIKLKANGLVYVDSNGDMIFKV